jgi:hypothetical protein
LNLLRFHHDEHRGGPARPIPPAAGAGGSGIGRVASPLPPKPRRAATTLSAHTWIGLGLIILGAIVADANWPGTEVDYASVLSGDGPRVVKTGDQSVVALGLVLAGIGQLVLLVAIIGHGVRLGIQAADEQDV